MVYSFLLFHLLCGGGDLDYSHLHILIRIKVKTKNGEIEGISL
jgi:hypothetical protein